MNPSSLPTSPLPQKSLCPPNSTQRCPKHVPCQMHVKQCPKTREGTESPGFFSRKVHWEDRQGPWEESPPFARSLSGLCARTRPAFPGRRGGRRGEMTSGGGERTGPVLTAGPVCGCARSSSSGTSVYVPGTSGERLLCTLGGARTREPEGLASSEGPARLSPGARGWHVQRSGGKRVSRAGLLGAEAARAGGRAGNCARLVEELRHCPLRSPKGRMIGSAW